MIFGMGRGNPASPTRRGLKQRIVGCPRAELAAFWLASFLLPCSGEHHVFRAAVLSIVLTLAVGQNATLLCRAWCDLHAAAASGCHHEASASSAIVAGRNSCDDAVLGAGAFLREEGGRVVAAPIAVHATFVPRHLLARLTTDVRRGPESGRGWSQRPLSTLRI